MGQVLFSLHDVCPQHQERVERAEALFKSLGIEKITYLLIPAYHGAAPCDQNSEFIQWCQEPRPYDIDWFLHGYTHQEDAEDLEQPENAEARFKQKYLTASEGEFANLTFEEAKHRVGLGLSVYEHCLHRLPNGFVSPAWLFNRHLAPNLQAQHIRFNEDHSHIYDLEKDIKSKVPVITWATRTPFRKKTSILGTPVLERLWRSEPVIRVACHPFDFDHPDTVNSIKRIFTKVMQHHEQSFYHEAHLN